MAIQYAGPVSGNGPLHPENFHPEFIPTELTARNQWVCWRYEERDGKRTKAPINARSNGRLTYAKSNAPETWASFDTALTACGIHPELAGVGFCFAPDDGMTGLDLDHVFNPGTGELTPNAAEIVERFAGTYIEISPSGTGIRIFCKGKPRRSGKNIGPVKWCEVYAHPSSRYLTLTGNRWSGANASVTDQQAALDWLHGCFMESTGQGSPPVDAKPRPADPLDLDDTALLDKARRAKNGADFERLWAGDTSGHGGDASAADLALCNSLAFWTGDAARMDRLFRQSGLFRPAKWDKPHRSDGATYGRITIEKALSGNREVYSGRKLGVDPARLADPTGAAGEQTESAPAVGQPESTDAVELCSRSNFGGDLERLKESPTAARLATARAIVNKYAWQSPWKRPYPELNAAISKALGESEEKDIARLVKWHEQQARRAALDGIGIDAEVLRSAGIDVVEVDSIGEAYADVAAHPEALSLVKASLGAGKTSGILQPLANSTLETTVAITNRQSLVADLCSRLQLSRYDELPARSISSCTELGICLKSVTNPKFAEVLGRARMVLVDEISAVVREAHDPAGVLGKSAKLVWEKLGILLRGADKGACGVDADLCTADVLALKDLMQGHRPIRVIVVKPVKAPPAITFTSPDVLLADLLKTVESGLPCRIFSDSAKKVRELSALLKESFPEKSIMAIHAQGPTATTGSPEVKEALANINGAVHGIDILLHTPAVESGVSLTKEHFRKTFGLYCGSAMPAAFIQMLRRDRTAESATVAILGNGVRHAKTDSIELLNDMGDAHRRTIETAATEGRYHLVFEPASPWDARVAEYRAAANQKTNRYAQTLWFQMESMGATVQLAGGMMALPLKEVLEAKAAGADLAKAQARAAILRAPDITADARDEIQRQYQPTPADCAAAERFDLKQTLAVQVVNDESLDWWHEGKVRAQIANFEALVSAPLAGLATDAVEAAANIPLAARANRLALTEAIRAAFEVMGFDVCTGGGEVTEASVRDAFENLRQSPLRPVLEHVGLLRLDRMPKYPVRWCGDFLGRLGLALEVAEQRGPRGDRERVYRIVQGETWDRPRRWLTAPGWERMSAIIEQRRVRCTDEPMSMLFPPHVCTGRSEASV